MRFKLVSALAVLLLVGSSDARPPKDATPEVVVEDSPVATGVKDDSSWRPVEPRGSSAARSDSRPKSPDGQRELKDLQSMDQSLRTVATQLLNVTNPDDATSGHGNDKPKLSKAELPPNVLLLRKSTTKLPTIGNFDSKTKSDMELVQEINSEISSLESMGIGFGRPTNSKFGYFESSHPGQAMAMTEEELERELATSSTRLITAHKNHPTTTGGISTWILLNSPTTTVRPLKDYNGKDKNNHSNNNNNNNNNKNNEDKQLNVQVRLQTKVTTPVKIFETTLKTDMKTMSTDEKTAPVESTTPMHRITTLTKITTPTLKKTTAASRPPTTTMKTTQATQAAQTVTWSSTSLADATKNDVKVTTSKPIITKKPGTPRPTPKSKLTTPKPANVTSKPMTTKLGRPGQSGQKPKTPPPSRKPTAKPTDSPTKSTSTSKIEKVTFRPVQMITTPKSLVESIERPAFVTKVKTSLAADSSSKTTSAAQSATTIASTGSEDTAGTSFTNGDLVEVATKTKPQTLKSTNNVLKVQLKKPTEVSTKIEIEPIKVNAPVLRIEKIDDKEKATKKTTPSKSTTPSILDNSRIDLKFDFNPELTRIDVETSTIAATSTKRPHKRKKNKVRRRKPTTSAFPSSSSSASPIEPTSTVSATTVSALTTDQEAQESLTELGIIDNSIQESKIDPESKVSGPSGTKNKKKQVQKPIGTQIYNFLSREVIPSFGVMSLVGLGLGLASYFLYPFGGVIARRNYVVEPNYKYNLDEYGGNYGQNEEEVFSKVLQGMTSSDGKYGGIKDYENNFHRYQHVDAGFPGPHTTRKSDPRFPTSAAAATAYRPLETTMYDPKFRETEFKYPDVAMTTPHHYERRKPDHLTKKPGHGDRQFVVGNVPKEYGFADRGHTVFPHTTQPVRGDYDGATAQNHKFVKGPAEIPPPNYDQPEAQALKGNEGYEEIEIAPAAVAVEHGPRSLDLDLESSNRRKRESVNEQLDLESPRGRRRRMKRESVIQLIPSRTEIEKEEEEIEKEEPLSNEILDIIDSVIPEDMIGVGQFVKSHHDAEKKAAQADDGRQANPTASATTEAAAEATARVDETSTEASPVSTSTVADSTTSSTTTVPGLSTDEILGTTAGSDGKDPEESSVEWFDRTTTERPHEQPLGVFGYVKKIAEVKLRLGIAILKHATEGLARYLGHIQKRVNGEE